MDRNSNQLLVPPITDKNPLSQPKQTKQTTATQFMDKLAKVGVSSRVRANELLKLAGMDRPKRRD